MLNAKNTKTQGEIGIAVAISELTKMGYTIAIPLVDNQSYDLIADKDGKLNRVQVKTTRYIRNNAYAVNLSTKGGNRSFNTIKKFDNTKSDFLFILTETNGCYLIPSEKIDATSNLVLGTKYDEFRLGWES